MTQHATGLFRVGFDLDGVLSRTEVAVLAALKAAGLIPQEATEEDIKTFNYSECFPAVAVEFVTQLFAKGDVFDAAPRDPQGLRCLNCLTDLGVETHIVTHRPWPHVRAATADWLQSHGARYSHLTFVQEKCDKASYCSALGLDVFIEDHLETAEQLTRAVRLSLLLDRPYNRTAHGYSVGLGNFRRFYRFAEVLNFFGVRAD